MLFVSYDIANDKLRTKFSKLLLKYGRRLQYSVFEIQHAPRILNRVVNEIENNFKHKFSYSDSVLIWQVSEAEEGKVIRYGYSVHDEEDLVEF
jgi:CRISPR-associated protein Cas2